MRAGARDISAETGPSRPTTRMDGTFLPPPRKQRRRGPSADGNPVLQAESSCCASGDSDGGHDEDGGTCNEAAVSANCVGPSAVTVDGDSTLLHQSLPLHLRSLSHDIVLQPWQGPRFCAQLSSRVASNGLLLWLFKFLTACGARVDATFAACREWFEDLTHIGWASCRHVDRPSRRDRRSERRFLQEFNQWSIFMW